MGAVFLPRPAWVLSGSVMGWGDALLDDVDAVVFLTLDPDVRMRRLRGREDHRHGGRVPDRSAAGEAHRAFMTWAAAYDDPEHAGRSRAQHERWLAGLPCPILRLDGSVPVDTLVAAATA